MNFTPFEKMRNLVIVALLIVITATGFNIGEFIITFKSLFIGPIILCLILWSYRNYRIYIGQNRLQLYKAIGKTIDIDCKEISKIQLESNKYGKLSWEMIYIYTESKIYEYSITGFNQNKLIRALISFSASNNIELDLKKYCKKRFDII